MGGSISFSGDGQALAVTITGAVAEQLRRQAKASGETAQGLVKRAILGVVARDDGIAPMPSSDQVKTLFAKMRRADAADDWQDYVDWSE